MNRAATRPSYPPMRTPLLLCSVLLAVTASACVVHTYPAGQPTYNENEEQPGEAEASAEPPAPQAEAAPPAPGPNHVWIQGHWAWRYNKWVWVNGHWHKNSHKKVWVAGHWRKHSHGRWVWVHGHWQ